MQLEHIPYKGLEVFPSIETGKSLWFSGLASIAHSSYMDSLSHCKLLYVRS